MPWRTEYDYQRIRINKLPIKLEDEYILILLNPRESEFFNASKTLDMANKTIHNK